MLANAILFIIGGWEGILAGMINLAGWQDVQPNASIVASVSVASGYLHIPYAILPATTLVLLGCLAVLLVFEGGLASYKILKWGYTKIPGIT